MTDFDKKDQGALLLEAENARLHQMLAAAPHGYTIDSEARMVFCPTLTGGTACTCWKAPL